MEAPALNRGHGEPPRLQKVIVAVDESECSHHALEWTLRNLAPTLAPPLLLLTVQPLVPLGFVSAASFGAPPPELIKSMQEQQRELTQALLDKARAICAEHGVAVETIVEVGDPKEVICESAEKKNVDLMVLGSHSRGPIQSNIAHITDTGMEPVNLNLIQRLYYIMNDRLFLGSVSNYCVHHSKCPVLVVKKQG